jgi:hypothetical protein
MKKIGSCRNCYFWLPNKPGATLGECKRYPPVLLCGREAVQPDTWEHTQCGEFVDDEEPVPERS